MSLAHEMHNCSQIFLAELCSFMDSFYLQLCTTSGCTEAEAWELTSSCMDKVFEELRVQRAFAANAAGLTNHTAKLSAILWAI